MWLHRKCGTGDDDDDYVNASYVQPLGTTKCYIATQGPFPATFTDFLTSVSFNPNYYYLFADSAGNKTYTSSSCSPAKSKARVSNAARTGQTPAMPPLRLQLVSTTHEGVHEPAQNTFSEFFARRRWGDIPPGYVD